jgi:hypothetical protein
VYYTVIVDGTAYARNETGHWWRVKDGKLITVLSVGNSMERWQISALEQIKEARDLYEANHG